jgi:Ca2+-binding EF-hand superfamily protein
VRETSSGDGTLTRKELKLFLSENYILKFRDFYTNEVRGELDEIVVDTLMDLVDVDGDGKIKYDEFTEIVLADANAMPNT